MKPLTTMPSGWGPTMVRGNSSSRECAQPY